MSHITHRKFHRLATLVALAATALTTAACMGSPKNSAQAPLDVTTTVTQVTTISSVSSLPPAAPAVAPEAVYYANCSEARATGAAPIYVGEPGYSCKLDRDGDGIACE